VATNSLGSATSNAASLTVTVPSTDYYVDPSGQTVGSFTTVTLAMQAVAAASPAPTATKRAHVYIAPGIYNEQPSLSTPYVSLIGTGASAHDVVIAFPGVPNVPPTSFGATLTVARQATAFMATNLTLENSTADQNRTQALALRCSADRSVFYRCRFLGYQDTILLDQLSRHYFLECFITGDVDYIYGDAIAVFDKCLIQTTEAGYITAASTAPTTATGFVLFDCTLVPGVDRNFPADNNTLPPKNNIIKLGRPWQWSRDSRASVVFIRTKMAPHMMAKGWDRWNLAEGANLTPDSNTRYAEFDSMDLHGTPLPLNTIPPTRDPNDNNDDSTTIDNDENTTGSTRVGVPVGRCGWQKAMTAAQAANYTLDNIFGPASFWNTPGRQPDGFREAAASASGADPATFQYTYPDATATWDPKAQLQLLPR
jgi:pectinesterase